MTESFAIPFCLIQFKCERRPCAPSNDVNGDTFHALKQHFRLDIIEKRKKRAVITIERDDVGMCASLFGRYQMHRK